MPHGILWERIMNMENDLKEKIQRISAQEKHLLAVKRRMKWWTAVLVLLTLVALGLFGMAVYPDSMQKIFGIELKAKADDSKTQSSVAYLGVEIQDLKEGMAETLNLRSSSGVVISRVAPSSPAVEGGLKAGDIILRYNRSSVESTSELQDMLAAASPGDRTKFVVDRSGQIRTFYVVLGERPSNIMQTAGITLAQTNTIMEWGCTLSPLTPVLVQKLSIPSSIKGVVVVAVASSGLAKSAGILPGDVIVSVNRRPTRDLASFYEAIENQETLVLEIYRSGQIMYLQVQASSALPPLATIAGSLTGGSALPQRVAIAANGNDLNAQMALRFGPAPYFIIIDLSNNQFVAIPNTTLADSRGYGIAAAQLVAAQGAKATIAGAYGPQAYDALKALGITPFTANPGNVSTVLNQYRLVSLSETTSPTLPGYGYARSIIPTGGSPFSSDEDEEEEEQSGYKGIPYTIPPQGKYDPEQDPANAAQVTAGSSQRTDYCYCPTCKILVPHPPSVPCAELACPQCGNRLMNWDSGTLAPGSTDPLSTYIQPPTQNQIRTGTINPVSPGSLPGSAGSLYLNQQIQYCYCPICNVVYEHPAGVPCSSLVCKACGSRLISLNPSVRNSLSAQTSAGTVVGGQPANIPPVGGQTSAGTVVAGQPGTIPPMGQTSAGVTVVGGQPANIPPVGGQTSAGTVVAGQPGTIPPMGQTSVGVTVVGGQPANIPPVGGQTSAGTTDLSVGVLQGTVDGNCVCPRCGTTVPHLRGTACYTIPCPKCNTLMVREGAVINPLRVVPQNIYSTAQSSAGTVVGGQPANIPPIGGQTSAGTVTAGQPGTIPPMGQTSAGVTVAGIPNISTGIAAAGQPVTITPMGQTSAGVLSSALTIAGTDSGHICIAATGSTIDAPVADLFDRAPYFLIVGLGSFRAIPNPNVHDLTGVGVQSAQLVVSEGAKAVITNDIGIKALEELNKLQVHVYTGVTGSAKQALEWYQNNRLSPTSLSATGAEQEEHGPPSSSKAKAKGESSSKTL